jgi:hypothetical protein
MIHYKVTCQDETGRKTEVVVRAGTDAQACDAALRTLNSWRAVRALPHARRQAPQAPPVAEPVVETAELQTEVEVRAPRVPGPRVLELTTPSDWVRDARGKPTAMAEAFRKAAKQ